MDVRQERDGQDLYDFGTFTLDASDPRLTRGGCSVHLTPKTYDVLLALVSRGGHLVTKCELLEVVWPGVFVDERILTVHVAALRRVLGDTRQSPAYIETVSRWGYRFIGVVRHAPTAGAATSEGSAGIARRAQS